MQHHLNTITIIHSHIHHFGLIYLLNSKTTSNPVINRKHINVLPDLLGLPTYEQYYESLAELLLYHNEGPVP